MKLILLIICISLLILLFTLDTNAHDKIVFCYYASRAVYRQQEGKFRVIDIDPYLCTHVAYSFVDFNNDGAINLDSWADTPELLDGLGKLQILKKINSHLKTILVIGGQKQQAKEFAEITQNFDKIQRFIQTAIEILNRFKFDGLDINLDYPNNTLGTTEQDKNNFTSFLHLIKEALHAKNYTLSAAVAAQESKAKIYYDIPEIHKYLDFINLKTYDFYGIWNDKTGFHSPLEGTIDQQLNVIAAVEYWLTKGVPSYKLVMGISFYGHTFVLKSKLNNNVGAPILSAGPPGLYTQETGIFGYLEICALLQNDVLTEKYNRHMKSIYAYNDHLWISYENRKSIYHKVNYIKNKILGGVMIWSIDADDVAGICGPKFPLLHFIDNVLNHKNRIPIDQNNNVLNHKNRLPIDQNNNKNTTIQIRSKHFECPGVGLFLKSRNCKEFYICTEIGDRQPAVLRCPTGFLFDKLNGKCNLHSSVNCNS